MTPKLAIRRLSSSSQRMGLLFVLAVLGFGLSSCRLVRADEPVSDRGSTSVVTGRLTEEARVAFTEGPVWHPSGRVLFSDIANNRIMAREADGQLVVFRQPSGRTNGMVHDLQGRLICCEGGGLDSNRRVTRTESDGTITVLADRFDGKKFNSPNDVIIDHQGRVYFSDPRYGSKEDLQQRDENGRAIEGVYRIDAPGKISRVITHEVDRPNGLAISPDGQFLYVADNVNDGPRGRGGNRKLWRFVILKNGDIDGKSRTLIYDWESDRGPDGLAVDTLGRVYAAAGFNYPKPPVETAGKRKAGIYVIDPQAKTLVEFIPVPIDMVTNCAFGGDDRKTLYVTAGHKLWSLRVNTTGHLAWPPQKQ